MHHLPREPRNVGVGRAEIDLATINHSKAAGTPLEFLATEPNKACETCHMPK